MTLDEAIKHAEEVANGKCDKCAEEHRQLAEWLKDYKRLLTSNHNGKCDRCGGEIYPNTLCIECNDYLARSVFAEDIKQDIAYKKEIHDKDTNIDYGVRSGLSIASKIVEQKMEKPLFRDATKEERDSIDRYIESISIEMIPISVLGDIKADIEKEREYNTNGEYDKIFELCLLIIDKHTGKEKE